MENFPVSAIQDKPALVSIALCTYNGAAYLNKQLNSLAAQTYTPLEIVVVDDGSTDNTLDILNTFSDRLPLLIYQNSNNLGYIKNFEKAVSLCSGEFIALCDQDDIWVPEKIEKLVNLCKDKVLVYADAELVDSQDQSLHKRVSDVVNPLRKNTPLALLLNSCAPGNSYLFRRKLAQYALPFPVEVPHDWWLMYVATTLGQIGYLDTPLVKYRQHASNVTNITGQKGKRIKITNQERRNRTINILNQFKNFNDQKGVENKVLDKLLNLLTKSRGSNFNLQLFWFLYYHRQELYYTFKKSNVKIIFRIMKESFGS